MGKLTFAERAWEEYLYWQENDKKTLTCNARVITTIESFRAFLHLTSEHTDDLAAHGLLPLISGHSFQV